jgi:hypothetical protein
MLLRRNARGARRLLAEMQESPQRMAQRGEHFVMSLRDFSGHNAANLILSS